jgi:uncharacterized protein (DUF342 family)
MDARINRAKIITKSNEPLQPKIVMTSLLKPVPQKLRTLPPKSDSQIDVLKMFQTKNEQLEQELKQLKKKLAESQRQLRRKDIIDLRSEIGSSSEDNAARFEQSSYMFKLIRENERLKEELGRFRSEGQSVGRGGRVMIRSRSSVDLSRSCEDIRGQVERSHMMMHNKCLQNQVSIVHLHVQYILSTNFR